MNIVYLEELKEKGYSQTVRDNSPRGCHTVLADDVKIGDAVLINNHWHTVVEGQAHVVFKSTLKRIGRIYRVKDDSPSGYHDVAVDQIRPGDVVLVGYRHFKVRDIQYKVTYTRYKYALESDKVIGGDSYLFHTEEEAVKAFEFYKKSALDNQKHWNATSRNKFAIVDMDIVELDEDLDWWEIDDSLWINREHFVTSIEVEKELGDFEIIIPGTNVVMERDLTEADALDIIYKYIHEDRANKEEQIGYILRNTLTGEETLIDC